MKTTTVQLEQFKNSFAIGVSYKCEFGNLRKANMDNVTLKVLLDSALSQARQEAGRDLTDPEKKEIETKAKKRLKLKKELIESPQYEAIKSFYTATGKKLKAIAPPSYFIPGFLITNIDGITAINSILEDAISPSQDPKNDPHLPELIAAFISAYPAQVQKTREVLEPVGQFNPRDYPDVNTLAAKFGITWNVLAFSTPEGLPPELKAKEQEKLAEKMTDAGNTITDALRVSLAKLVDHLTERLTSEPGEKAKTFRDSAIGNIQEFIDGFKTRNVMNDTALEALVMKAKAITSGLNAEKLRTYSNVRENTVKQFAEIKTALDGMITTTPTRKFNFDDDEPAAGGSGTAEPSNFWPPFSQSSANPIPADRLRALCAPDHSPPTESI